MTSPTAAPTVPALQARTAGPARPGLPRLVTAVVVAAVVLVALALLSVAVGARPVGPGVAWQALWAPDLASTDHLAVRARVPRTVLALVVGAALGLGGALMQGVTRNPLADPGLLGVNAGAAFCVVLALTVFGVTTPAGYVWFAFAGAAVAAVVVYAVAGGGRRGATPLTLALAGAAVTAALTSLITAVLLTSQSTFDVFRFWQVGSIGARGQIVLTQLLPFLLVGAVIAFGSARLLNVLQLGDDVARGLGQDTGRARALVVVAIVLLCGGATAAAGPIGFVGLAVPHVARGITGPDHRWLLPLSALLGAGLLTLADVVGRVVARPGEVQAGVITVVIGVPVFIALVRRVRMAEL